MATQVASGLPLPSKRSPAVRQFEGKLLTVDTNRKNEADEIGDPAAWRLLDDQGTAGVGPKPALCFPEAYERVGESEEGRVPAGEWRAGAASRLSGRGHK
jgi:hypothetical protein